MVQPQLELIVTEDAPLTAEEHDELERHEAAMDRCRDEFMVHLSDIHAKKLYRAIGTLEEYCQQRWGYTADYARKLIRSSEVVHNLTINTKVSIFPITETQARPLTRLNPDEQANAWREAVERSNGQPTAKVVEQVVNERYPTARTAEQVARAMLAQSAAIEGEENDVLDPPMEAAQVIDIREATHKPRVNAGLFSSATPEWYTPRHIINQVEKVFGQIGLDPCSNSNDPDEANVPALAYWTQTDDGIKQPWHGKVYMNPPYGDEISVWVARMVNAYEDREIIEAIALLPARTDTAWFQSLLNYGYPICFVRGRLKFSGAENSAPFPSAVVYLGRDRTLFDEFFNSVGPIR